VAPPTTPAERATDAHLSEFRFFLEPRMAAGKPLLRNYLARLEILLRAERAARNHEGAPTDGRREEMG
jgi:hypothetical protein